MMRGLQPLRRVVHFIESHDAIVTIGRNGRDLQSKDRTKRWLKTEFQLGVAR